MKTFALLALALALAAAAGGSPQRGRRLYARFCVSCHGRDGTGNGPSARWLDPRPRDFTRGVFRCRSTPGSALPTDADLLGTLSRGLAHSQMPGWVALSDRARRDLVAYVKSFSPRFASEQQGTPVMIPPPPPASPERIAAGRALFEKMQCYECHGDSGRGDGTSAATTHDDWGWPVRPQDLTQPGLRCGEGPETIVKDLLTGLAGTPMPSFADALSADEAWSLAYFVWSLSHPGEVAAR